MQKMIGQKTWTELMITMMAAMTDSNVIYSVSKKVALTHPVVS